MKLAVAPVVYDEALFEVLCCRIDGLLVPSFIRSRRRQHAGRMRVTMFLRLFSQKYRARGVVCHILLQRSP